MEQASSSIQLTVIDIVELLDKPLLGTLVAVLAGEHDAIPRNTARAVGKIQPLNTLYGKGCYQRVRSCENHTLPNGAVSRPSRASVCSTASWHLAIVSIARVSIKIEPSRRARSAGGACSARNFNLSRRACQKTG
jgi:hypothetical protein